MRFDIQVQGLNGLRRASGLAPRRFDMVLRDAIRVSAIQMRHVMLQEVGRFAVGGSAGAFAQTIRYRVSGLSALIGSMAPTALSIEAGRRVGEIVAIGLIRRWIVNRGIVRGTFDMASHELAGRISSRQRRFGGVVGAEIAEARRIVALIRAHGTHPKLYGQRTVERSKDRVLRNFRDSTAKALRGLAQMARAA